MNPNGLERLADETRLESWKEIGAYLQRNAVTARRWEKEEGLPVHRHSHKRRSSVYAYASEIDAWRASRKAVPEPLPLWKTLLAPPRSLAVGVTLALCLVMVGNGIRPQTASAQTKQAARQVWAGPVDEVNIQGSISADGRFLSFTEQKKGDLAIRNLETGEIRRLTSNSNDGWETFSEDSMLSADGRQVAYAWYTLSDSAYDLRVIATTGAKAEPKVLYRNKEQRRMLPFGWLPDGGVLAYTSARDRTHQIISIRGNGSGASVLKSFDWRSSNKLSVSPDGRFIAYDFAPSEDNPEHDIYLLAVDGSREARAVQSPADDLVVGWAPDGKTLLFASDRTGTVGLFGIAVADGKPVGQAALLKKDIGRISALGVSSRGTLYYSMAEGIHDIHTVSIDPKTLKPVSEPKLIAQRYQGFNGGADWSPDGKYLAYASKRGLAWDSPSVLTIHSLADGSERDVVTKLSMIGAYRGIRWWPDGRSIVVRGWDRKGQEGLFRVDVQNGATVELVRGVVPSPFVWGQDRRTLYFVLVDGKAKIMALDTRDESRRQVHSGLGCCDLAISPDGKMLAFLDNLNPTGADLMLLSTDGGAPRKLLEGAQVAYALVDWTPDGESIVFGKPGVELWRVNVRTGEQSPVEKYPTAGGQVAAVRISPDGRRLSYLYGAQIPEVWALENFLPQASAK